MEKRDVVVAIDIGTTKILALIAEVLHDEKDFRIIGYGMNPSRGLSKGIVVDVEEATTSIESALHAAEHMADVRAETAFIGVAGKHIESLISHAVTTVGKMPKEITEVDRQKLEEIAESKVVPIDRKVIHKIVYNYRIDEGSVIKNPVGMTGVKIEADVHIVTGGIHAIESLVKCVNNLDMDVEGVVLEPLASAKSVLTDTEKKLGSILVDIGGGTTDIAVFKNEKLIYTSVIPLGGEHFTTDIASVLNIDLKTADRLKKEFSSFENYEDDEVIEIPSYGSDETKKVEVGYLKEIIDARIDDILEHVSKKIEASGYKHLVPNGLVFTGGSSKIAGLKEKAEPFFELPVRLGFPVNRRGLLEKTLKPEDATGVGLVMYGVEKCLAEKPVVREKKKPMKHTEQKVWDFDGFIKNMKTWFENLF